jgi:hypothetical protein
MRDSHYRPPRVSALVVSPRGGVPPHCVAALVAITTLAAKRQEAIKMQ